MRKVVPPLSWLCGALIACVACGEASYTPIAVIEPTSARDGGTATRDSSDRNDSSIDRGDCVILPENSAAIASSSGDVTVTAASASSCDPTDAGAGTSVLPNNVFRRRDGAPLVEAGQLYSFHWSGLLLVMRVRIYGGGDDSCPSTPLVDQGVGLLTAAPTIPSCQEFTPDVDADELMLFGADFFLGAQTLGSTDPLNFMLCPSSCPPNSQAPVSPSDAGVADAGDIPQNPWDGAVPPVP